MSNLLPLPYMQLMISSLKWFVFGLLFLLTGACQKDTAKPVPSLLGRWNAVAGAEYEYNRDDKLLAQHTYPPQPEPYYMLITQDSLKYISLLNSGSLGKYKIIRQGDMIQLIRGRVNPLITKLTAESLILRFPKAVILASDNYIDIEDHYSR